jgi:hypothetical protein
MKIIYKIEETGQAVDLRYAHDSYDLQENEYIYEGSVLPDINSLHQQAYLDYLTSIQYQTDRREGTESNQLKYASIGDQLDMQYWDAQNGTAVWKDHIAAVKLAHPKPE